MGLSDDIKDPVSNKTLQKVYDTLLHSQNVIRKIGKLEITEEHIKTIKRLMEKKTKKMTKAEAFEWLDGKKIRTEGNHEKVLRKLFDLGFVWKNLRDTRVDLGWQSGEVYGLTISDDEVAWWTTPHLFETHGADAVTADDILSIEIIEEDEHKFSDYVAILQSQLGDNEVTVITKTNFITLVK